MKYTILSIGIAFVVSSVVASESDTTRVYPLGEVVVTATKSAKPIREIARSVSVIPSSEFQGTLFNTAAEILSLREGIYIVGTGQAPGSIQTLFMRGANSNHTTVLLDGVRLTDPASVQNTIDLSEVSIPNTERIEIVRGSHGTLFGSSAIGGVVNMFSKTPRNQGISAEAELSGGTFKKGGSTFSQYLRGDYRMPIGVYLQGEILNQNVRGFNATTNDPVSSLSSSAEDADNFENRQFGGKIGYTDDQSELFLSYRKTDQEKSIDAGAFVDDDNWTADLQRGLFGFGASHSFENGFSVRYNGGYTKLTRSTANDSSFIPASGRYDGFLREEEFEGKNTQHELQVQNQFEHLTVILGASSSSESMTSRSSFYSNSSFGVLSGTTDLDSLNLKNTTNSLFSLVDLNGGVVTPSLARIALVIGIRWNNHSSYGNNVTFEISPSLRVADETLLFASYATGFNAPSLYQLGAPDVTFGSNIRRGNPDLEPERARSLEIGIKQSVGSTLSFTASYFSTTITDYIDYVYLWTPKPIDSLTFLDYQGDTYLNTGRQVNTGIEIGFESNLAEEFSIAANVSLIAGTLEYDREAISNLQSRGNLVQVFDNGAFLNASKTVEGLARRPTTANVSFVYKPLPVLRFRLDLRYAGPRTDIAFDPGSGPFGSLGRVDMEGYSLVDLTVRYSLFRNLTGTIRVENIFDTEYSEILGYATRGRGLYGGVRFSL